MLSNKCIFETRHVLYCDILGFSAYSTSLFFEASRCFKIFHNLDQMIAEAKRAIDCPANDYYVVKPEIIYCSDSIIVSTPAANLDAIWLCDLAVNIQNFFALSGFILRGAIVSGKLYHSGNTVFGPAIAEAVKLDKSKEPPAIIVSDGVIKSFMAVTNELDEKIAEVRHQQLIFQSNKKNYIDPFCRLKFAVEGYLDQQSYRMIESWRDIIVNGFKNKNRKISVKYIWLAKRFNRSFCTKKSRISPIYLTP